MTETGAGERPTPAARASSFVGRDAKLAELSEASVEDPLVTVVGPPGVGKSRLVRVWAETHGAPILNLSGARDRQAVLARIGEALTAPSGDGSRALAAVAARSLVVLDHAEEAAAELADLLAAWRKPSAIHSPAPRFIIVTRAVLDLPNQRIVEVPPLEPSEGFALFVQRARASRATFSAAGSEAAIERIVARIDALPLAIELCAARMRVLSPEQVLSQMEQRLGVLGVGGHALRAAIASSVDRLEPQLRRALAACATFRGSFSLAALADVIRASEMDAMDAIQSLADSSLLVSTEGPQKERRYRLYESVRELLLPEVAPASLEQHEAHFWSRAAENEDVALVAPDLDNFLAAYTHALPRRPERALQIALALGPLLRRYGPRAMRVSLPSAVLDGPFEEELPIALRIDALLARSAGFGDLGDRRAAHQDRARALDLARETSPVDCLRLGRALAANGRQAWHDGDLDRAEGFYLEALDALALAGDATEAALTQSNLANILVVRGQLEDARSRYEAAIDSLRRAADSSEAMGLLLGNLGSLELDLAEHEVGLAHLNEAIATLGDADSRTYEAAFRLTRGSATLARGDLETAERDARQALSMLRAAGELRWQGAARVLLGEVFEARGDIDAARRELEGGAALLGEHSHRLLHGASLCKLARLEATAGRMAVAERHLERGAAQLASERPLAAWVPLVRAHLALLSGDIAQARALADEASVDAARSFDVHAGRSRLLAELPAAATQTGLSIGPAARWFALGAGAPVDLSRRQALRLILKRLADVHEERPDTALSVEEVFAAGWPDERIHPEAAQTRVYTAVAVLRRMGLRHLLVRRDDGYLLDPSTPINSTPL